MPPKGHLMKTHGIQIAIDRFPKQKTDLKAL